MLKRTNKTIRELEEILNNIAFDNLRSPEEKSKEIILKYVGFRDEYHERLISLVEDYVGRLI